MIDGVTIRLLAAVWKLTVAIAWQIATTTMTTTVVARSSATRQNPPEPKGMGLSQARMPTAKPAARTMRTDRTIQYRRLATGDGSGPDSRREGSWLSEAPRAVSGLAIGALPQEQGHEHDRTDDPENERYRNLEGHDHGPGHEVADGDDADAEEAHPREVAAQVVTTDEGDDVRHDESEERE